MQFSFLLSNLVTANYHLLDRLSYAMNLIDPCLAYICIRGTSHSRSLSGIPRGEQI
uniref:Uncharacterized protein n=1 Tax=Rhizophora mucronata TaxID=61149 RepID=A0A2P2N600_RHIMU